MTNIPLQWVHVHVSALGIGHLQVVLTLVEQLYKEWGIMGGWGWWDEIETLSCTQCNFTLLIEHTVVL